MINITNDLSQFERGLLFYNCPSGVLIDNEENEYPFKRNFTSERMESDGKTYLRTGEIFESQNGPAIVYRENV